MIILLASATILFAVIGSLIYGRRTAGKQDMAEWAIGGRRFGNLVFWVLNAGEIYTTFAVLGISGFAWANGAPAFMSLCSVSLSAVVGYWLTNVIGLILLHKGAQKTFGKSPLAAYTRRDLLRDAGISLLYTLLIVVLVKLKVVQPITDYLQAK